MAYKKYWLASHLALTLFLLVALLVQPIAIDTAHIDDMVLLTHLGWRGMNGLSPVIDFQHFWGGATTAFMSWAFQIFGASYRSVHFAFAMLFGASVAMLWILGWRRTSKTGLALLTALAAVLILSLAPIELGRIDFPRSAHSFVYNHVGVVLMMGLTLYALGPIGSRRLEVVTALVAGVALYALVLIKPTFGIFAPFVLLVLLLRQRWLSAALVTVGAVVGMMLMDPGMTRALGSLEVLMGSAAAAQISGPVTIATITMRLLTEQGVAILVGLALLFALYMRIGRPALLLGLCASLCVMGYTGTILAMGGQHDYKLLPILVVVALVLADALEASYRPTSPTSGGAADLPSKPEQMFIGAIPLVMAYSLILPATASAAATALYAFSNQDNSLVSSGPASEYVVKGAAVFSPPDLGKSVAATRKVIDEIQSTGRSATHFDDSMEYVMLADGIDLLRQIPDVETYGIVSNGRMFDFTMPLMAPPVLSYPVWPTGNLEFFSDPAPLGDDVDLVMIARDVPKLKLVEASALQTKMAEDFVVCRTSELWTLHSRRSLTALPCDEQN